MKKAWRRVKRRWSRSRSRRSRSRSRRSLYLLKKVTAPRCTPAVIKVSCRTIAKIRRGRAEAEVKIEVAEAEVVACRCSSRKKVWSLLLTSLRGGPIASSRSTAKDLKTATWTSTRTRTTKMPLSASHKIMTPQIRVAKAPSLVRSARMRSQSLRCRRRIPS